MNQLFKRWPLAVLLVTAGLSAFGQKTKKAEDFRIPMEPAYWSYNPSGAEFFTHRDVKAVRLKAGRGNEFAVKDKNFTDGTIEYDVEFGRGFTGIYFRMSPDRSEGENFYIRFFGPIQREWRTSLQYAAIIDSVSMWDITDEYQAGASINTEGWNHVKLVISGRQMKAYVNDMTRPALLVPELEGKPASGNVYFAGGEVIMANVVIKPNVVEDVVPQPGYQATYNDTRYLRNWYLSPVESFPFGREVVTNLPFMGGQPVVAQLPDSTTKWQKIKAEGRSIVNVSRVYGHVLDNSRRIVWLKTTIKSTKAQERTLSLGFSDDIWLLVNGQILYIDKNTFGSPGQKFPRGRCTIENATVKLPLREGNNEILVGLANYFYGWGIIARLDDTEGIQFGE